MSCKWVIDYASEPYKLRPEVLVDPLLDLGIIMHERSADRFNTQSQNTSPSNYDLFIVVA